MAARTLVGFAASPGQAAGPAVRLDVSDQRAPAMVAEAQRPDQLRRAQRALEQAASEVDHIAARLHAEGRSQESEVVETGVLMARDPMLAAEVARRVLEEGRPAGAALLEATESFAASLAALPDPTLAERADDVRSLGRRAAAAAGGAGRRRRAGILVAAGLGPADVAELGPQVLGVALAGGGVTAHAAIVARSLGIPMVVGFGAALSAVADGETVTLDGERGELVISPGPEQVAAANQARERRRQDRAESVSRRLEPAQTRDGRRLRVLANAASAAEVKEGLEQGAEGVGLLRTELLFLEARAWPTADQHARFLEPLLAQLAGCIATVRLLDFGGDKTPPFLRGATGRGVELMLDAPEALRAQLDGILRAAGGAQLRVLVPMVTTRKQLVAVRRALSEASAGGPVPQLGAMIETPEAARHAAELTSVLNFISLGTNDLTQLVLGVDREQAVSSPVTHPAVLRLIATAMEAGAQAGIPVEVCGEAASDPAAIPLLVGLGADELSVGAARVGAVRELVRGLDAGECRRQAERALLDEARHAGGERG